MTLFFNKLKVGNFPDCQICIWDWEHEQILLKSTNLLQDTYQIRYSHYQSGSLATSGVGYIKFWNIARTFTGLKLQGRMGKFGTIDESDIADLLFLPSGKILSATDRGELLVWEGGFVKCIVLTAGKECYNDLLTLKFTFALICIIVLSVGLIII